MIEIAVFILATIIGTVIGTVLAMEAWASAPHLGRWLVRGTIAAFPECLPEPERERWAEELESDFLTYDKRRLAGLVFAIRLRVKGGRRLAGELAVERLADRAAAAGDSALALSQAESAGAHSHLRQLEGLLAELTIRELALLAREETGLSLEQLAAPRSSQRHRAWRRAVQRRLAREMIGRYRRSSRLEGES